MTLLEQNVDDGWEIQDPFYSDLYHRAEHLLRVRQNTIHTRRAYHLAIDLLEEEGGDADIVLPAIILHDVGYSKIPEHELMNSFGIDVKKPELSRLHEVEGARLAGEILKEIAYPDKSIEKITTIIDGHDTRLTALDIDDKIVKDADKLWRFTREGFHIDFKRFGVSPQEWLDKLKKYALEWFFTKTGKRLSLEKAERRKKNLSTIKVSS